MRVAPEALGLCSGGSETEERSGLGAGVESTSKRSLKAALSVAALLLTVVGGMSYVWFGTLGARPFAQQYHLTLALPDASDMMAGSMVRVRGVDAGTVTSIERRTDHVVVQLEMSAKYDIPATSRVQISKMSAIDSSYVNFLPADKSGPYLTDGMSVRVSQAPMSIPEVFATFNSVSGLLRSPGLGKLLQTVGSATDGTTEAFRALESANTMLATMLSSRSENLSRLLSNLQVINNQLNEISTGIREFGSATRSMLEGKVVVTLKGFDKLLKKMDVGQVLNATVNPGLLSLAPNLPTILANLGDAVTPLAPVVDSLTQVLSHGALDIGLILQRMLATVSAEGMQLTVAIPGRPIR